MYQIRVYPMLPISKSKQNAYKQLLTLVMTIYYLLIQMKLGMWKVYRPANPWKHLHCPDSWLHMPRPPQSFLHLLLPIFCWYIQLLSHQRDLSDNATYLWYIKSLSAKTLTWNLKNCNFPSIHSSSMDGYTPQEHRY